MNERRCFVVTGSAVSEVATISVAAVVLKEEAMRVTSNGKVRRTVAEWQTICEQFAQSGLGPKEFCRREALALGSFRKWGQRCVERQAQPPAFVELTPASAPREPWAVEVELPSGVRLRFRG